MDRTLQELRKRIELIDGKIIDLIAARQKLAPQFAAVKKKLGLPLHQQRRERELLNKYERIAAKKNISTKLIRKIFPFLFHASLREQRRPIKKKD